MQLLEFLARSPLHSLCDRRSCWSSCSLTLHSQPQMFPPPCPFALPSCFSDMAARSKFISCNCIWHYVCCRYCRLHRCAFECVFCACAWCVCVNREKIVAGSFCKKNAFLRSFPNCVADSAALLRSQSWSKTCCLWLHCLPLTKFHGTSAPFCRATSLINGSWQQQSVSYIYDLLTHNK